MLRAPFLFCGRSCRFIDAVVLAVTGDARRRRQRILVNRLDLAFVEQFDVGPIAAFDPPAHANGFARERRQPIFSAGQQIGRSAGCADGEIEPPVGTEIQVDPRPRSGDLADPSFDQLEVIAQTQEPRIVGHAHGVGRVGPQPGRGRSRQAFVRQHFVKALGRSGQHGSPRVSLAQHSPLDPFALTAVYDKGMGQMTSPAIAAAARVG